MAFNGTNRQLMSVGGDVKDAKGLVLSGPGSWVNIELSAFDATTAKVRYMYFAPRATE